MTKKEKEQMEKYLNEYLDAPVVSGSSLEEKYGDIYPPKGLCIEVSGEAYEFLLPFFDGVFEVSLTWLNGGKTSTRGRLYPTAFKICSIIDDKTIEVCLDFPDEYHLCLFRYYATHFLSSLRFGFYNRLKLSRFREECARSLPASLFRGDKHD